MPKPAHMPPALCLATQPKAAADINLCRWRSCGNKGWGSLGQHHSILRYYVTSATTAMAQHCGRNPTYTLQSKLGALPCALLVPPLSWTEETEREDDLSHA